MVENYTMKKILFLILFFNYAFSQDKKSYDWANLIRYKQVNGKLEAPDKSKKRVVFIGDSITEYWMKANPNFFSDNYFLNRGIGGQSSPQVLLRFQQDVIALKPYAVIINVGTNDIAENIDDYDPIFTIGNIKSMIAVAKANKIKVILSSVLPATKFTWNKDVQNVPEKIIALNSYLKSLAATEKVIYIDYFNTLKNNENGLSLNYSKDGVHPNLDCYKIMESLAQKALNSTLN